MPVRLSYRAEDGVAGLGSRFLSMWRLQLFGGLTLRKEGATQARGEAEITRFRTRKAGALLAFLALHPGSHTRDALAVLLWPDASPTDARNNLRVSLSALRTQLEPSGTVPGSVLRATRLTVQLSGDSISSDVQELASLVKAAAALTGQARVETLHQAFTLYRGPLLAGYGEEWSESIALYHESLFGQIAKELVSHYRVRNNLREALAVANETVLRAPNFADFPELVSQGQNRNEFHLIQASQPEVQATPRVAESAPASQQRPLPVYPTSFFGREIEMDALQHSLAASGAMRLYSIVGPPAIGKTRLAVEAAHRVTQQKGWRAHFIGFAAQASPQSFGDALRAGLGLPSTPHAQPFEQAVVELQSQFASAEQGVLLVLDNLEHLMPDIGLEVHRLRVQVPELLIWATTRTVLGLPGEDPLLLSGLPVPLEDDDVPNIAASPSVRLFLGRARSAKPAFGITPANSNALVLLCRRLEGWPLALELAAARSHSFTPAQMLSQLEVGNEFLQSRQRRNDPVLTRQSSLNAAIKWSYELLTPESAQLLLTLAVFRGGATRETLGGGMAAPDVDRRLIAQLAELVAHSLVKCDEAGGELRYDLLEGVRQFAFENLSEEQVQALRSWHAGQFLKLVRNAVWAGPESPAFLQRLDIEVANLRAALSWAEEVDVDVWSSLCSILWRYWEARGLVVEGRKWIERLLASEALSRFADLEPLMECWNGLARLSFAAGDLGRAATAGHEALKLAVSQNDKYGEAQAKLSLGLIGLYSGQVAEALETLNTSRVLFESEGDAAGEAYALTYLGFAGIFGGHFDESFRAYQMAVAKAREAGDLTRLSMAMFFCGDVLGPVGGRYHEAAPYFEEALATGQRSGDIISTLFPKWGLCRVAIAKRDLDQAQELFIEIDEGCRRYQYLWGQLFVMEAGAFLAAAHEDWERTALLLGAAERWRETMMVPLTASYYAEFTRCFSPLWARLSPERINNVWMQGRRHSVIQALDVARWRRVNPDELAEEVPPSSEGVPLGFPLDPERALLLLAESHYGSGRLAFVQNDGSSAGIHFQRAYDLWGRAGQPALQAKAATWLRQAIE